MRPDVELLYDSEIGCDEYVLEVMQECWSEYPDQRPDFVHIRSRLKRMKEGKYVLNSTNLIYTLNTKL